MKKLLTFVLVMALVCTMNVVVFAGASGETTLDNVASNNSTTATVDVIIDGSEQLTAVYNVVVSWDSLDFTYSFTGDDVWDPEDHVYTKTTEGGGWNVPGAKITVTNHSNAAIRAKASFSGGASSLTRNDVTATIDMASFTVGSAVGTEPTAAPSGSFTCSVSGVPSVESGFTIGTITITIESASN